MKSLRRQGGGVVNGFGDMPTLVRMDLRDLIKDMTQKPRKEFLEKLFQALTLTVKGWQKLVILIPLAPKLIHF